ncbi:FdrA family protein [Nocardioides speluncae]|uniref:FdrA family protein n=1 Tax=Nocardioides speluncae TaxID=2670337 RepID=UPI000D69F7F4|nr:FdrA family protein [Nocardioides speluncae]
MTDHVEIRPGAYADSVSLLQVSRDVAAVPGVVAAQVAMATPLNLEVLDGMGFAIPDSTPNDMVVALRLAEPDALDPALAAVAAALAATGRRTDDSERSVPPRTTRSALRGTDADLVLVSVPGQYAFVEAMDALDAGRDVMVFSDNVPLAQEVALKRVAADRGLLVMGPDCGTAMVGGVGLGFANTTAPGPVGIVAASGTGCQQLMCLLDSAGVGVAAALGVGGHDLGDEVGGLSTRTALQRLDQDPAVEYIVVVSKPPAAAVAAEIEKLAESLSTPVGFALLGPGRPDLTAAAEQVLAALGIDTPQWPTWGTTNSVVEQVAPFETVAERPPQDRQQPSSRPPSESGLIRGLFVGGTLASEAAQIMGSSAEHTVVDFGDDALTQGRAHPMIDPTLRLDHLARAAADPDTAVLLLDVVLGHGAEPDPAAALAPAIEQVRKEHGLPVVTSCVGTESDPQGLTRQAERLAAAGAEVYLSNAAATRRAIELAGASK